MMSERDIKYWIIAASKDHVKSGAELGIVQACHGKSSPLKRMKNGDFVVCYSGKQTMDKPDRCQEFTALGRVTDDEIYQEDVSKDFSPSRRKVEFFSSKAISILPLIEDLTFIQNKEHWGYPFRFGFLEIKRYDFELISSQMQQIDDEQKN
jgi:predicted RNA-binding protein